MVDAAVRASLALRDDELERIARELGREPTVVELHAFDAQWSEHCSYKSSRHHLKRLPTDAPDVLLGPGEDSGIVYLGEHEGERYGIVVAHESHNHPSQVVPFEGAATGIGGIVRDVLCMGAQVIAVADPLRFGRVEDPDSHQRYVARSVVDGIGAYGNAIGVPNVAGDAFFDERFNDNCLVNVVALGIVKEAEIIHSRAPEGADGWDIVLVGKATDPSGFGGASFSSVTLDAADEDANKGAVQVPDPFLKNVLMRASYRVFELLRERKVTVGFKDLGAGGIMGCSAEITSSGGYGADINLDEVNVAVEGMPPEVIAVGETQERLIWVLPPSLTPDVLRVYNAEFTLPEVAYNARAVIIGRVTKEQRYVLRHRGEIVMDVPSEFLTGSIKDELPYVAIGSRDRMGEGLPKPAAGEIGPMLERVLAHRDVCSREPLYRRYDWVVRGTTVLARGVADAGVIAPIPGSRLGMALSVAGNPRYGHVDAGRAAELAVLEAARRVVAVGAHPIGLTDCLNFGNPRKLEQYSELVASIDGLKHAAQELGLAFVSGNVSLYNESKDGESVPASPIVACIGRVTDIARTVTPGFKEAGSALYVTGTPQASIGGSVLAEFLEIDDVLPFPTLAYERQLFDLLLRAMEAGYVRAARTVSDGGLLTTIAKMAFGAARNGLRLGAQLELAGGYEALFGEGGGLVVEVRDVSGLAKFVAQLGGGLSFDAAFSRIGQVAAEPRISVCGETFEVAHLYDVWSKPLEEIYP